mgnify:CR=1 FL=1
MCVCVCVCVLRQAGNDNRGARTSKSSRATMWALAMSCASAV